MTEEIATIKIGADYFRNCARKDYSNPLPFVWIREALQNSLDAGANHISIDVDEIGISVTDNGCGMTAATIQDKLLTLGGTHKEDNSVGGFGKAKEILFFAWNKWYINTHYDGIKSYIDNTMIGNSPITSTPTERPPGTRIKIVFGRNTEYKWEDYVTKYIKTLTTKARILVDGIEVETYKTLGNKRDLDWCVVTPNKSRPTGLIFIRIGGITMFVKKVSNLKATITVDLTGNSTSILAANRDNLRWPYSSKLDTLLEDFITNKKSSIQDKPLSIVEQYQGMEAVDIKMNSSTGIPTESLISMMKECTTNGLTNFMKLNEMVNDSIPGSKNEIINMIKKNSDKIGPMGYEFIVKRDGKKKPNMKIDSKKTQTILHYWTNIVVKLVKDLNVQDQLGVGLIFEPDIMAQMARISGKTYFLINPNHIEKTSGKIQLGIELFHKAAHELTHLYYSDHDEDFTSKYGTILKELSINWAAWNAIFIESKKDILRSFNDR